MTYKSHLKLAHQYWQTWLHPHDVVIDATCGNGKDTQILASLVPQGKVYSMDIQVSALENAKRLVTANHVVFLHQSHIAFPPVKNVKLVVYNLGYLPGGDKMVTTLMETTLISLEKALEVSQAVSITCYPGHPEGGKEKKAVLEWSEKLDKSIWTVTHYQWGLPSPSLLWIIKNQQLAK